MMIDSECDSCGALLPHPDLDGNVTCSSCGRASRVAVTASQGSSTPTPPAEAGAPAATEPPSLKGGCLLIAIMVAGFGIVAVALALWGGSDGIDGSSDAPRSGVVAAVVAVEAVDPSGGAALVAASGATR